MAGTFTSAVVGDYLADERAGIDFVTAGCPRDRGKLRLYCLSCRQLLANEYQLEIHVAYRDQAHCLAEWCEGCGEWHPLA